jgi:rod shape-determining protein MreB
MDVTGRNLITGLPKTMRIYSDDITEAVDEPLRLLTESIQGVLEHTPAELASDIFEYGIMLSGGGALLAGLDLLISRVTGIRTVIAKNPIDCVAVGIGRIIETTGDASVYVNYRTR